MIFFLEDGTALVNLGDVMYETFANRDLAVRAAARKGYKIAGLDVLGVAYLAKSSRGKSK